MTTHTPETAKAWLRRAVCPFRQLDSAGAGLRICRAEGDADPEQTDISAIPPEDRSFSLMRDGKNMLQQIDRSVFDKAEEDEVNMDDMNYWFTSRPDDIDDSAPLPMLPTIANSEFTSKSDNWEAVRSGRAHACAAALGLVEAARPHRGLVCSRGSRRCQRVK